MSAPDPFTNASQSYQNARRHGYKSGQAWEGYTPRRSGWWLVAAAVVLTLVGLGLCG